MKRIVYLGAVVSNGGDAAIMTAQFAALGAAYPGHLPVLHDSDPVVARRLVPTADVLPATSQVVGRARRGGRRAALRVRFDRARILHASRLWRLSPDLARRLLGREAARQVESLAGADLVAYTGGTSLIEKYDLSGKVLELQIAAALGRPVVLLPQSLGPFTMPQNQDLIRSVVSTAALVLLRDYRSRSFLAEIHADLRRVLVVPDIVFALTSGEAPSALAASVVPRSGARIAISVRDCQVFFEGSKEERVRQQEAYEVAVAGLVTNLVQQRQAEVTFLSTCQGVPEYWADDSAVALSIVARLAPGVRDRAVVDREHRDAEGLSKAYGTFDLAVCTRLHAGILALAGGTPVLPIAYEFKTHEVMQQLGLGDYVSDVQTADAHTLVGACDRLLEDLPALRGGLAEELRATGHRARETGGLVAAALGDG